MDVVVSVLWFPIKMYWIIESMRAFVEALKIYTEPQAAAPIALLALAPKPFAANRTEIK